MRVRGYHAHTVPGFVISLLRHVADDVQVVMSRAAEIASRNPVFVDMFDRADGIYVPHIELTRDADLTLVYPATMSLIGKLAHGIADELIPALLIASESPTVIVPVANDSMLAHPATVRNLVTLREDGYVVIRAPPRSRSLRARTSTSASARFPTPPCTCACVRSCREISGRARRERAATTARDESSESRSVRPRSGWSRDVAGAYRRVGIIDLREMPEVPGLSSSRPPKMRSL